MTARYLCTICNRTVARTHVRRHLDAHVNNGIPLKRAEDEWKRYGDVMARERDVLARLNAREST